MISNPRKKTFFILLVLASILIVASPVHVSCELRNTSFNASSSDEVKDFVSRMQHLPSGEPLPYDDLEMEMSFRQPLFITKTGAKEDTEILFYLLENGYAGYGYFNKDNLFQEAKDAILREIDDKIVLTGSDLSAIFYKRLNFLHDCHLKIGEKVYKTHLDYWYNTEFKFTKENQDYVFTFEGKEHTVESINNQPPDDFMSPSINANGEPVYQIGLLSMSSPGTLELIAENNAETSRWSVSLQKSEPEYSELYAEKEIGGVPIVRIRTFSDHHIEYINEFLNCAYKYRESPCLIVDIRGNGGGNTAYARRWITQYTGEAPVLPQVYTELVSETSMMGRSNYFAYLLNMYPELEEQGYDLKSEEFKGYAEDVENGEASVHWSDYFVPSPQTIANNRTLIVLIDKYVSSAAEGFLSYLQFVEKVVFVGENSGGALTYGQMTRHMLPNSRIFVDLPISLNVFVDLEYREEKGFNPDLWVPSEDALNYAVAAVRYGSIETTDEYRNEIMGFDFLPETKPVNRNISSYFPILFGLFYGVIVVYFNRKVEYRFYLGGGIIAILVGTFLPINQELGMVFVFTGVEYLVIAVYRWRKESQDRK